jgi:hypothetical protein
MEDVDREVRSMLARARSVGRRKENKGEEGVPEHQVIVRIASTTLLDGTLENTCPWVVRTGFSTNRLARLDAVFSTPAVQQARFRRYRHQDLEYRLDLSDSGDSSSPTNTNSGFTVFRTEPVVERTMALYRAPPAPALPCHPRDPADADKEKTVMGVLVTRGPKPRSDATWRFPWSTQLHDVATVKTETVRLGLDATLVRETVDESSLQFVRVELGPKATWLHARTVMESMLQAMMPLVTAVAPQQGVDEAGAGGSSAAQRPNAESNLQRMR